MKYILTKDLRVFVQGEETDKGYEKGRFEVHSLGKTPALNPVGKEDILKEASTIEELLNEVESENKNKKSRQITTMKFPDGHVMFIDLNAGGLKLSEIERFEQEYNFDILNFIKVIRGISPWAKQTNKK